MTANEWRIRLDNYFLLAAVRYNRLLLTQRMQLSPRWTNRSVMAADHGRKSYGTDLDLVYRRYWQACAADFLKVVDTTVPTQRFFQARRNVRSDMPWDSQIGYPDSTDFARFLGL